MGCADVVLNEIVFVLIGLQLPYVMGQISGMSRVVLLEYGIGFSVVMMAVGMAWYTGKLILPTPCGCECKKSKWKSRNHEDCL